MLTKLYPAKIENDALLPVKTKMSDTDSFLDKTAHINERHTGRIILALDATFGSEGIWDLVRQNQPAMFLSGGQKTELSLQLAYYRGTDECRFSKWISNPQAMHHALGQIECEGHTTQLSRLLSHAAKEHGKKRVSAFIFIGDRIEEDLDTLAGQASELAKQGFRAFMLQDGFDENAHEAFQKIADVTNGICQQFDRRNPKILEEALPTSAIFATSGIRGLSQRTDETSKLILSKIRSRSA